MTFIVSSHFIKALGRETFFSKIWRKSVKPFSKAGPEMKKIVGKISSKQEV
jgi:hypothetical protein